MTRTENGGVARSRKPCATPLYKQVTLNWAALTGSRPPHSIHKAASVRFFTFSLDSIELT
jgi:hypothetical protein